MTMFIQALSLDDGDDNEGVKQSDQMVHHVN
jgi:hypothetical protein